MVTHDDEWIAVGSRFALSIGVRERRIGGGISTNGAETGCRCHSHGDQDHGGKIIALLVPRLRAPAPDNKTVFRNPHVWQAWHGIGPFQNRPVRGGIPTMEQTHPGCRRKMRIRIRNATVGNGGSGSSFAAGRIIRISLPPSSTSSSGR